MCSFISSLYYQKAEIGYLKLRFKKRTKLIDGLTFIYSFTVHFRSELL